MPGKKAVMAHLYYKFIAVMLLLACMPSHALAQESYHELTWDNLLLSGLKLEFSPDYKAYAPAYLQIYDPSTWQFYHENEFERSDVLDKAADLLMWKVADFNHEQPYAVTVNVTFGKYNFDTGSFFFKPFAESTFLGDKREESFDFPKEFRIYFSNWDGFNGIPMKEEDAKALLASLRDVQTGEIPRLLTAKVIFVVESLRDETFNQKATGLNARITEIILAKDPDMQEVLTTLSPR